MYQGVTLDITLSYKKRIRNTNMKVATWNSLRNKLFISKWETNARTIKITVLALCYSVAEYASEGKISACAQPGPWAEQRMQRDHWMSQSVQGRRPVLASRNYTAGHSDILEFSGRAKNCMEHWKHRVWWYERTIQYLWTHFLLFNPIHFSSGKRLWSMLVRKTFYTILLRLGKLCILCLQYEVSWIIN